MNRLDTTFARLREANQLGLFPYLTTGHPDPESCEELLRVVVEAGADGIEFGVPFSDPLADGATIQRAGATALKHGASIEMALSLLAKLRTYSQIPVTLMSYYNPILAYGIERLAQDGAAVGLDGLIVPDVPVEEAEALQSAFGSIGLHVIMLLAPTSTTDRLIMTGQRATGFIYCVALTGVTGARTRLADDLPAFLGRVRENCGQPLVVGFGISKPEHAQAMHGLADGVIVASALIDLIESTPPGGRKDAVRHYVRSMKEAAASGLSTARS